MAVGTYQLPSPQALDPYNVETQLAHDVGNPLAMLAMYRSDRGIAQQGYDQELQNQHAFAQQQLKAQIQEHMIKGFTDLAKIPGGVGFAATSGVPGLDLGASPEALTNLVEATDAEQRAKNFQAAGAGANSFAQGGWQVPSEMIPGMPGGLTNLGPALVQAARIRAAASGGSDDPNDPKLTVGQVMPGTAEGIPGQTYSGRTRLSNAPNLSRQLSDVAQRQLADRNAAISGNVRPPPSGGGTPDTSAQPSSSTGTGGRKVPTNTPDGKALQDAAMIKITRAREAGYAKQNADSRAKAMYDDVVAANPSNPAQQVHVGADGKPYIQGKTQRWPVN